MGNRCASCLRKQLECDPLGNSTGNTVATVESSACETPEYGRSDSSNASSQNDAKDRRSGPWKPSTDEGDDRTNQAVPSYLPSIERTSPRPACKSSFCSISQNRSPFLTLGRAPQLSLFDSFLAELVVALIGS